MHTTKHPTIESRLATKRAVANEAECQKRLGRVYGLILSYDPQKKAAAQGEVSEAAPQTDNVQSAIG